MALTYNGSTAGSTLANPPVVLASALAGHVPYASSGSTVDPATYGAGAKVWFYSSTNNPLTEILAAGTFNDGPALGMARGDVIIMVQSSAGSTSPIVAIGTLVTSGGSTSYTISSNIISSTAQ